MQSFMVCLIVFIIGFLLGGLVIHLIDEYYERQDFEETVLEMLRYIKKQEKKHNGKT